MKGGFIMTYGGSHPVLILKPKPNGTPIPPISPEVKAERIARARKLEFKRNAQNN
jgi:hypothetical protein